MKNYDTYELEDFVADEAFCRWVLYPDEGGNEELLAWIENHPEKQNTLEEARMLISKLRFKEASVGKAQVSRIWDRIEASTAGTVKKLSFWNPARISMAIAAGIALLLAAYLIFRPLPKAIFAATDGETRELTLPDGSEVVLNASSEISYDKAAWKAGNRTIDLKGEAYFSVTKGKGTFTVNSTLGSLTVLGTRFNVFDRGSKWEVKVFEGRVAVETASIPAVELTPGTLSAYVKDQPAIKVDSFAYKEGKYQDWKVGYFYYEATPLEDVLEEIGRQYGKEVEFNSDLADLNFTGPFERTDLNSSLKEVLFPFRSKLAYFIEGEKIIVRKK